VRLADVQFRVHGRAVVARLAGEIDLSNAQTIGDAVAETMPNHAFALVLDLTDIDYLDSAGIQLLYRLREELRVRGQILRVVIPASSPASDALRLAGVLRHVDTADSVGGALREFE
jgi:anti-sigma B factor antagonist